MSAFRGRSVCGFPLPKPSVRPGRSRPCSRRRIPAWRPTGCHSWRCSPTSMSRSSSRSWPRARACCARPGRSPRSTGARSLRSSRPDQTMRQSRPRLADQRRVVHHQDARGFGDGGLHEVEHCRKERVGLNEPRWGRRDSNPHAAFAAADFKSAASAGFATAPHSLYREVPSNRCSTGRHIELAPGVRIRYFPPPPRRGGRARGRGNVMDFDRDFGVNQVFVEDQYERWRDNPGAVDPEWQQYFARLAGISQPPPPVQTSVLSVPQPTTGNGNGNGSAAIALRAEGSFGGALLDLSASAPEAQRLDAEEKQEAVAELINAYRIRGHLFANIDPLGLLKPPPPELDPESFGLTEEDLEKPFATGDFDVGVPTLPLREIVARLKRTYCRTIGVEYMHGEDPSIRRWLQQRMESTGNEIQLSREEKLHLLARLTDAETLETFLHKKYI